MRSDQNHPITEIEHLQNAPYDPRRVANFILDEAEQRKLEITNLALQKLLYFAHGLFLLKHKQPLVSGYFEAWDYGPVHVGVYEAFKCSKNKPITFRAESKDILSGEAKPIPELEDQSAKDVVLQILLFGQLSPHRLVAISHAENSPWHFIVDKAGTDGPKVANGSRIPDSVIVERFKYHKISITGNSKLEERELNEEVTPFERD